VHAVIALATTSASSQVAAAATGDHDIRRTPAGTDSVPAGSNSHTWPICERARIVAPITSGLVEVLTAGPDAAISAGIITAVVFPDRGGPRTITADSGSAAAHSPFWETPRYAPPPARRIRCLMAAPGLLGLSMTRAGGPGRVVVRGVRVRTPIASVRTTLKIANTMTVLIVQLIKVPPPGSNPMRAIDRRISTPTTPAKLKRIEDLPLKGGSMSWWEGPHD
jgi:hypothetical protein